MSNDFTDTELLNQYLDGELDDSATQLLEKRLAEESSLRLELEQLKLAREAVKLYGLKMKVKSINEEMNKNRKPSLTAQKGTVRSISRWSLRAAAVIVLLIAGYGIYEYARLSNANLYADLYQPYKVRVTRGEQGSDPVESAFRKKDYLNTIATFHSTDKHSASDYFFVSQAYLQTKETRKPSPTFSWRSGIVHTATKMNPNITSHSLISRPTNYQAPIPSLGRFTQTPITFFTMKSAVGF